MPGGVGQTQGLLATPMGVQIGLRLGEQLRSSRQQLIGFLEERLQFRWDGRQEEERDGGEGMHRGFYTPF